MLVDVLFYYFGGIDEGCRVFHVFFEGSECSCILEAVAGALVGNDLEVNYLFGGDVAVFVELVDLTLRSVGNKHGKVSEVVEVVIYRFDSERAHARDYHRAPEGKAFGERLGAPAKIIERFYYTYCCSEDKTGKLGEAVCDAVCFIFGRGCSDYLLVKSFVHVENRIARIENDIDRRFGSVHTHSLFDDHEDLDLVTGEDPLSAYETVKIRILRDRTDVCGKNDVEKRKSLVASHKLLADEFVRLVDVYLLGKLVAGVVSVLHNKWGCDVQSVKRAELSSVAAVADLALSYFICGSVVGLGSFGGLYLGRDVILNFGCHIVDSFNFCCKVMLTLYCICEQMSIELRKIIELVYFSRFLANGRNFYDTA